VKATEVQDEEQEDDHADQQNAQQVLQTAIRGALQQAQLGQGLHIRFRDQRAAANHNLPPLEAAHFRRHRVRRRLLGLAGALLVKEGICPDQALDDRRDQGDFVLAEAHANQVWQVLLGAAQRVLPDFRPHHPLQHADDLLVDLVPPLRTEGQNSRRRFLSQGQRVDGPQVGQ